MDVERLISISLDLLAGTAIVVCIIFFSMLVGLYVEGNKREDADE